ncbi:hypothetical protein QTP70_018519 [Hemibagrus guttatus]|uniref:Laminin EGF-like domain-containing protein n=1 Tax=Hemibagrus guttatus TaxID=175788 RepID=A0AAE0UKN6_9TELE|nr:hypothetical protein QTP70_018519 [Hemibagrus guttatus]
MLVFPLFKLLLLACTTGWCRALRSHGGSVVPDNQLEVSGTTTSPNHLPEEKLSLLTSPPFPTTPEDMIRNDMVTNTVAPSPQTMAPAVQNSTNISLTTVTPSSSLNTTAAATTDLTTTPDLTTEKGLQCNCSTVGSVGPDSCDPLTGGCKCLHGYSGLRCEQCYSGYFRNHTGGCQPCACDSSGAVGPQCNSHTEVTEFQGIGSESFVLRAQECVSVKRECMATSVTSAIQASLTSAAQDAKRANATITPTPVTNNQAQEEFCIELNVLLRSVTCYKTVKRTAKAT